MGQSALRDRRTPFRERGIEKYIWQIRPLLLSKGNRVNIPEPGHGDRPARVQCGNANELGDDGGGPGKSSLFFVRDGRPGIGLP